MEGILSKSLQLWCLQSGVFSKKTHNHGVFSFAYCLANVGNPYVTFKDDAPFFRQTHINAALRKDSVKTPAVRIIF